MNKITAQITTEDIRKSGSYLSNVTSPLAIALKRMLPKAEIFAYGSISNLPNHLFVTIDKEKYVYKRDELDLYIIHPLMQAVKYEHKEITPITVNLFKLSTYELR